MLLRSSANTPLFGGISQQSALTAGDLVRLVVEGKALRQP